MIPRAVLKSQRAQPFYSRHPWVFAGAIGAVTGEPADGAEIDLFASEGNFIARGLYNGQSKIRIRLFTWEPDQPLDRAFFEQRLKSALHFRERLGLMSPGHACRLVNSEADGLSGLIVDRYADQLAVQFTSLALAQRREMFAELLAEHVQPRGICLRTERGIGKLEGLEIHDGPLAGEVPHGPFPILENGLTFLVNLREGQKTGYFLDQRDNRQAVARFAAGRCVLDAFCYSGGFALHAARSGATSVTGIDSSEPALALARENTTRNQLEAEFVASDVFDGMTAMKQAGRQFDLIVLDPPKFARTHHAVPDALRGYRRLQKLALSLLTPDGILVMCCCSGLITMTMLEETLAQVSTESRREMQILERRGAAPDHPVAISCLQAGYLKCVIVRVL